MKPYTLHRALVTLTLLIVLTACNPSASLGPNAASPPDPLSAQPADIVLALAVPESLRLSDGDAILSMGFAAGDVQRDVTASLDIRMAGDAGPEARTGERVYLARVSSEDSPALARLQADIRALRADGIKGQGTLAIQWIGGCFTAPIPQRISLTTWIQTDPEAGFVQLGRSSDIARSIGPREAALLRSRLRQCDS